MRRIISSLIIIAVLLSLSIPVYAAEANVKSISLDSAIDTAVKGNTTLKNLTDKIDLATRRAKYADDVALDADKNYGTTYAQHVSSMKDKYLYPMQRKADLNELIWQKADTERVLRLDVTKLYYQILYKQDQIDLQGKVISRLENEYSVKKKEVDVGNALESTLTTLQISVDQAKSQLVSYQREKDGLIMDLNKKLGFDINQQLSLKPATLPKENYSIADLEKLIADAIINAHSVKKLESDKAIKEKEYWVVSSFSEKATDADSIEDQVLNLDYSIRDEKVAVEYKIRSDYNNVLNLSDDIVIKKLDLDNKEKLLTIAQSKSKLGLISTVDFSKTQGDRDSALSSYNKALLDYYIAVQNFKSYLESQQIK